MVHASQYLQVSSRQEPLMFQGRHVTVSLPLSVLVPFLYTTLAAYVHFVQIPYARRIYGRNLAL